MADVGESGRRRRKARRGNETKATCVRCGECCDVLVLAAVGATTALWKCPMMIGTDQMDRAVALAIVRAALHASECVVVTTRDLDCWEK